MTHSRKKRTKEQKRVTVFAAAICFAFFVCFYSFIMQQDIAVAKEQCRSLAVNESGKIATTVDSVVSRTGVLKALIISHDGELSWFDKATYDVYKSVSDDTGVKLKNIAVAPGGVVSNVYPLAGNESLVGFDYMDNSLPGNIEAKITYEHYERDEIVLTNPFELIQGGTGIAARAPVMLRYPEGGQRLWGLVTVTMDLDNLVKVMQLDNLKGMGLDYCLSYLDQDDNAHTITSGGNPGSDAVVNRFAVHNLTWELSLRPATGWVTIWRYLLSVIIIAIISFFAGMFANMVLQLRENNELLIRISNTDRLTDCLNRRAYEDALSDMDKGRRDKNFVYVSVDVNGLKTVNDNLGHLAGDELICGAADCLRNSLSAYGNVYRIGGDEFAALLSAEESKISEIMETLRVTVDGWKGDNVDKLSISFGYVMGKEFPDSPLDTIVKTADDRMYASKEDYYRKSGIDRRRS